MQTHLKHYLWKETVSSRTDSAGLCVQWKELDKDAIKVRSYKAGEFPDVHYTIILLVFELNDT